MLLLTSFIRIFSFCFSWHTVLIPTAWTLCMRGGTMKIWPDRAQIQQHSAGCGRIWQRASPRVAACRQSLHWLGGGSQFSELWSIWVGAALFCSCTDISLQENWVMHESLVWGPVLPNFLLRPVQTAGGCDRGYGVDRLAPNNLYLISWVLSHISSLVVSLGGSFYNCKYYNSLSLRHFSNIVHSK